MPYVFPYENVFMGGMTFLIIALLILRVRVARRRRVDVVPKVPRESSMAQGEGSSSLI
jgi:hypothetical protein